MELHKMNFSADEPMETHKEKERLRHQKQVMLLNDIMKLVPRSPQLSQTRVRKLRHLVLYYHFMQMVHARITKGCSVISCVRKKPAEDDVVSIYEPLEVSCEPKRKRQRANIVFLQVDRSENCKETVSENCDFHDKNNYQEFSSSESSASEFKEPEVVLIDGIYNNSAYFDQGITFPLESNTASETNSISSNRHVISPSLMKHHENMCFDFISGAHPKKIFYMEKENYSPVIKNPSINSSEIKIMEESSLYEMERYPQNITVIRDENLLFNKHKGISFQNISKDGVYDSNIKDLVISNATNESHHITNQGVINRSTDIELVASRLQNTSNYLSNNSAEKYENVNLLNDNLYCKTYYCFDSTSTEPQLYNVSSLPESVSDNSSSSSILTDKLNIDLENLSDCSNQSCTNFTDGDIDNGTCDTYSLPLSSVNYGVLENDYVLPVLPSVHNYIGNNMQNEILLKTPGTASWSYFENIHPTNINLEVNPPITYAESMHSFQDQMVKSMFVNDIESFYYSSPNENFTSEETSLHLKSEVMNSEHFTDFPKESKTTFFDEETSYPLSQYINC